MQSGRSIHYVIIALILVSAQFIGYFTDAPVNVGGYTSIETATAMLGAVTGILALVRYHAVGKNILGFVGTGFLGAAILDAYPVAVMVLLPAASPTSDPVVLMASGWPVSRLFLGAMLALGWWFRVRERRSGEQGRTNAASVYLISGLVASGVFLLNALVPALRADGQPGGLPGWHEFAPALLFLAALLGFLREGGWRDNEFDHWLVLSLIVALGTEVSVAVNSLSLLENHVALGMVLKPLSYGCVMVGLVAAMHRTYRRLEEDEERLATANRALEEAVAEGGRMRQALADREQNLRHLSANIPGIVYEQVLWPDGRMTFPFMSPGVREVCGLEASDIEADPHLLLNRIHQDDKKIFQAAVRQSAESLAPLVLDQRFCHTSGDIVWLHGNSRPRRGPEGTVIWDAIMIDVTDRKRAEQELAATQAELQGRLLELEQAHRRLESQSAQLIDTAEALTRARDVAEHANLSKSRFLANVSHELRTPLNAIIGLSAILREDTRVGSLDDLQRHEYLDNISAAGQDLLALINDILDLSKVEEGKFELREADFNLIEVIEAVLNVVRLRLAGKKVDLWSFVVPGSPVHLKGDPTRLRQVLLNLIDNAVKFTDRGSVVIEAAVLEEKEDGILYRFEVSDTGIGIPRDLLPTLFTHFTQGDTSLTRKFGGTGLGLALCKQLTDLMGGEIGAESEEGRGTTFWFTVRLGRSLPDTLALPSLTAFKDLSVLVVDPIEANRELLGKQFGSWGIDASLAADEAAARRLMEEHAAAGASIDVVLVNYLLAESGTPELAARLRAAAGAASAKLVLVSTPSDFPRAVGNADSPFDAILVKPVTQSSLFDCLAELFLEDMAAADPEHSETGGGGRDEGAARKDGLRILVVEDNGLNAMIIDRMLSHAGHHVTIAENGALALETLASDEFDLVLMDVQMPEMDGVEATRRIRALDGDVARIPIIALTAHAMEGDRENYLATGMDDYVSKPIIPDHLAAAIKRQTGVDTDLKPFMPVQRPDREIPQETLDALDQFMSSLDDEQNS